MSFVEYKSKPNNWCSIGLEEYGKSLYFADTIQAGSNYPSPHIDKGAINKNKLKRSNSTACYIDCIDYIKKSKTS